MKRIIFLLLISHIFYDSFSQVQNENVDKIYNNFSSFYIAGDLINAQKCLIEIVQKKDSFSKEYLLAVYNNLGVTSTLLGQYEKSLAYYTQAEELIDKNSQLSLELADIYINKARTYNLQKLFSFSIEYLENGLRIYKKIENPDTKIYNRISVAYQNLGISYGGIKNYKTALYYFEKCADLIKRYHLPNLALSYLNIANIQVQLNKPVEAEKYFNLSIKVINNESALAHQRLDDIYFDFGIFLRTQGRETEALDYHTKALTISLKNYGSKHPYVALAYRYIGDHYANQSEFNSALQYYQNSLISLVVNFNNNDINVNPSIDSTLLDLDLLKVLQKKSEVLEKFSLQNQNIEFKTQILSKSLETIELSLNLIKKIRNDYVSEESRLYLLGNEKETYINAAQINQDLFNLTGDTSYLKNMYQITRQAKSVLLHNEITDNELFYSIGLSDSIMQIHNRIQEDVSAYNKLIYDEVNMVRPDQNKIDIWKDILFKLNREKEIVEISINKQFPQYQVILQKAEPLRLEEIQNNLKADETLIEYLFSNKYFNGKRKIYIFTVTKNKLCYSEENIDSVFTNDVQTIRNCSKQLQFSNDPLSNYKYYTQALYNMYNSLIKPIEGYFSGRKLIIIPDEEISYLPFDAFIKNQPDLNQINYEGLQYLIKQYSISYGYSSSLIFNKSKNKAQNEEIYAFSPDYSLSSEKLNNEDTFLKGTRKEIIEILKFFKGKEFIGKQATEHNFKDLMQSPAIFHLAMHTLTDSVNSKFSSLLFDTQEDTIEDGYLHDYEINLCRITSPMIVLSACNTGTGKLYHGEGVMSITRSFILAGASSVIKTLWDVNDEASAKIVSSFYSNLSKGLEKDDALRLAKLEYMKNSSPRYSNPYFWASYQIVGDKSPLKGKNKNLIYIGLILLFTVGGVGIFYFKRPRSFSA